MTEQSVQYVPVSAPAAGAVPVGTPIATHARESDGKEIQDVWVSNGLTRSDDFFSDAFQRLRVSNTDQRFDVEFLYDKQPLVMDEITGGAGSVTHNANSRDLTITAGGATTADEAGVFQNWYNPYTPGNSQFVALTGTLNGANLAGTCEAFLRSNITGSVTTEAVEVTGCNWQFSQIFLMDFQSLKVGRIRYGIDTAGLAVPTASIENDNKRATGYWQIAHAPIYWRIYNTATETITEVGYGDSLNAIGYRFRSALSDAQHIRAICGTVKSEGGGKLLDLDGFPFRTPPAIATRTVSTTLIPIVSIQVQPTFNSLPNRSLVIPYEVSVQTDNPADYVLIRNGTLTGASFAQVDANSGVYADSAATAITGGTYIGGDLVASGGTRAGATQGLLTGKVPLSVNYAGTSGDILTIAAIRSAGVNAGVTAVIKWKEIR
jgi:hypothetical protein